MPATLRKLHIGGTKAAAGWEILNVQQAPWVDHVGLADDLSRFADNTFAELYASHVLEHLDYQGSLSKALAEWHRVLVPGGTLRLSVPDLDVLCELFSDRKGLSPAERFMVMRMIFGGHIDQHDYHYTGLNEEILGDFLRQAGFVATERVERLGVFADTSDLMFKGRLISLNVVVTKAVTGVSGVSVGTEVGHSQNVVLQSESGVSSFSLKVASASRCQNAFTGIPYDTYSFRELAPNWIDFALLSQRQRPPRAHEGQLFSYLELGSGMGLGLCLLAAAYPEGRFVGVDFHPSHIAHSQWLARELKLANISFHEADFLALAAQPDQLPFSVDPRFDYVAAHGILSWVAEPVRQALLALSSYVLRPGGAFYCSYNTFPGWLERTAFKALVDLERKRQGPEGFLAAMGRADQTLMGLLSTPAGASSALALALPRLSSELQAIRGLQRPDYLCGEYGTEHWQPFYVGEVHRMAAGHKLSYVASASLPENHLSLLPEPVASLIDAENDPGVQQALLDLAINQSFRRDLFVKGPMALSRTAQEQALALQRLRFTASLSADSEAPETARRIQTGLGVVTADATRCRDLEAVLAEQPASLGELYQALGYDPKDLVLLTSLLLHAGRLGLDRGKAGAAAASSCEQVNQRLMELMEGGHNLGFVAAPFTGHGAQPFTVLDSFVMAGIQQGLDGEVLTSCVLMGLQGTGVELRDSDGALLTEPEQCLRQIQTHITQFRCTTLPRLVQMGIVESLPVE